jgi:hypothetical protein
VNIKVMLIKCDVEDEEEGGKKAIKEKENYSF